MILREVVDLYNQKIIYALEDDEGVFCSAVSIHTDFQLVCGVDQRVAIKIYSCFLSRMLGIIFSEVVSCKIVGFRIVPLKSFIARELEKDPDKSLFQES